MSKTAIDAKILTKMFLVGAKELDANKDYINELNVFPVPDGDTGTNMSLTIMSAVKEVMDLGDSDNMKDICKAMSSGSLRGARGNSGVILSQLIRGFGKVARGEAELDVPILANAFDRAAETAYKAVMKPKEGTILTVARAASNKSRQLADEGVTDLETYFSQIVEAAREALASTPDLLPVLKQAGVVDSGGQGLLCVLSGAYDAYMGKEIDYAALFGQEEAAAEEEAEEEVPAYIYKEKFTIHLSRKNASKIENSLVEFINSVGDGIVCTLGSDRVKVSVQTNDPGMILQKALSYGDVSGVKIENVMMDGKGDAEEKEETAYTEVASEKMAAGKTPEAEPVKDPVPEEMPHKDVGFITVAVGEGIAEIFRGLGVDFIISGGQTMNPSTDDVLKAIDQVNADTIYILPNNKNIIMAANQAASLTEDKKIVVIPTKTIPQGITAVINYMPDMDTDANAENMTAEIANVSTAEITYAVRDTMIDDIEIHEGDFMGIGDAGIVYAGKDITETVMETMKKIVTESTEIISIYYGAEVAEEDASALRDQISETFLDCDVELQSGGQPVYYYILSAE